MGKNEKKKKREGKGEDWMKRGGGNGDNNDGDGSDEKGVCGRVFKVCFPQAGNGEGRGGRGREGSRTDLISTCIALIENGN